MEVGGINVAEFNNDFEVADSLVSNPVGFEGQAFSAVVVGETADGNINALSGIFAVGLGFCAETTSGNAVV